MNLADKSRVVKGRILDKLEYFAYRIIFPFENELFESCEPVIIRFDINYLREFSSAKNARNNDWLAYLMEIYGENYCPSRITYNALNQRNREKYFWLRLELDEALEIAKENLNSQRQPWL